MTMTNEVKILVRTQNSSRSGMEEVNKEVDRFAKEASETFSKTFNDNLTRTFTTKINETIARSESQIGTAGDRIGNTIGDHISRRITDNIVNNVYKDRNGRLRDSLGRFVGGNGGRGGDGGKGGDAGRDRVRVDVDIDKQSLLSRLGSFGKEAGEKFGGFFQDGWKTTLSGIFSGDVLSAILKGVSVAGLVTLLAPLLGAAVDASIMTVLGGGAIAIGVVGALKDPRIKTALGDLKKEFGGILAGFSSNFRGPLEDFLASPGKSKTGGKTGLQGVIEQIRPQIEKLGEVMGQATGRLLTGVTGMLQNFLPALIRGMEGAVPFIDILADELPGIGKALGRFFDLITNNSAGAQLFLKDFLNALEEIIPTVGAIIGGFSNMYFAIREFFARMRLAAWEFASGFLNAADAAFGWIPGLGAKFASAKKKVHQFMNDANRDLKNIHDVDVKVKLKVAFGNVWSAINQVTSALQAIGAIGKGSSGGSRMGGKRAGGVAGAASGGSRSGLTWTGEDGPELIDLSGAAGARVYTSGDSQRMTGQGGGWGGGAIRLIVDRSALTGANAELIAALMKVLRIEIRDGYGGTVQTALGS
jgi:hypothetical protein